MTIHVAWKSGYRLQLTQRYIDYTGIKPEKNIFTQWIQLSTEGLLVLQAGYACDGPSGIPWYSKALGAASFGHDALCQLQRLELLDRDIYSPLADRYFADRYFDFMGEDTDWKRTPIFWRRLVSEIAFMVVRLFADKATSPNQIRKESSIGYENTEK